MGHLESRTFPRHTRASFLDVCSDRNFLKFLWIDKHFLITRYRIGQNRRKKSGAEETCVFHNLKGWISKKMRGLGVSFSEKNEGRPFPEKLNQNPVQVPLLSYLLYFHMSL